jgi:hypothetical protein
LDNPLQVMIPLGMPDLHRQPLPLDRLRAGIAQPGGLSLYIVAIRANQPACQIRHAHDFTRLFRKNDGFGFAPVFMVGLGLGGLLLRHQSRPYPTVGFRVS